MKDPIPSQARGPIDLIEESCHLLRRAPAACLAAYYLGAVPFLLGLLYFTSDMSRSAFAAGRVGAASLGLVLLFFWMKAWQTVYADRLMTLLSGLPSERWTPARITRMVSTQAFLQPLGFLVLPLALFVLVPFGWAFAFFANVTVLGHGTEPFLRREVARAWRLCLLWPRQNHVLLIAYKLFFLFVLLNLAVTLAGLPWLLKTLLGIESPFTLSPWSMVNTTFFMCLLGLAYLCIDPLIKAGYVLRCFYGQSLQSGLDLKVDLAPYRAASTRVAASRAALLLLLALPALLVSAAPSAADVDSTLEPRFEVGSSMFDLRRSTFDVERSAFDVSTVHVPIACAFLGRILPLHERPARSPTPSRGITDVAASVRSPPTRSRGPRAAPLTLAALTPGPGSPPPAAAELDAAELDQSIRDVIRRHEYSWRLPREGAPEEENDASKSALVRFLESIGRGLDAGLTAIGRWIRDLVNWLRIGQWGPSGGGGPGYDWFSPLRFLLILLIAALAVLLAVLLHRAWKNRQPTPLDAESAAPLPGRPDLADESIGADQLPDDQWLALARDLAARGDLRLALRAFYLASLAHLAGRNLIALARFKSNLEYQRELDRRAHALPGLVPLFHHNVSVFDRVWYGRHEVTPEGVQEFAANVEKIRRQDHEHSHP